MSVAALALLLFHPTVVATRFIHPRDWKQAEAQGITDPAQVNMAGNCLILDKYYQVIYGPGVG